MAKNEIHARLLPEVMEQIRQWTNNWMLPTISHTVRQLIELGLKQANSEVELQKKNDFLVQLIEQELEVIFAECRDEENLEDSDLYWFWFEVKNKSLWRFDPDFRYNWCPTKRFNSREDAIRDCLKEKMSSPVDINPLTESLLPSIKTTGELTPDDVIDW